MKSTKVKSHTRTSKGKGNSSVKSHSRKTKKALKNKYAQQLGASWEKHFMPPKDPYTVGNLSDKGKLKLGRSMQKRLNSKSIKEAHNKIKK